MNVKRIHTISILLFLVISLLGVEGAMAPVQAAPPLQPPTEISFSGSEFLGNPTDTSITINIVPDDDIDVYYQYSTISGGPYTDTPILSADGGEPHEIVISGLQPDTRYFYRMQYQVPGDPNGWVIRDEYTFHTARPQGSTYQFAITADSHVNVVNLGDVDEWRTALDLIRDDNPDFLIDLGDTFGMDSVSSVSAADDAYLYQRDPTIMGRASHSVPIYLALGNHENEEGWNFDDVNPQPIFGMLARKRYFPLPTPNTNPSFYSTNPDPVEANDVANGNSHIIGDDQYREDYYAWEWGDVLFVVFDPFQYTLVNPATPTAGEGSDDPAQGDRWNWTMGVEQHQWLRDTLANSNARYKFLFAHHMLGGTQNYVRGGAEAAGWFEWGGCNANAPASCVDDSHPSWGFDSERPANQGWIEPVHQMMQEFGVQAFFHGHDHHFVHEERDGIIYQLVPSPSQGTSNGFNNYDPTGVGYTVQNLSNSGYLRVTIDPSETVVEYVKSTGGNVGQVQYSYNIQPNVVNPTPPQAADDNATTDEDTPADIDVLANDSDPDNDLLTVSAVTQPANGSAANNGSDVTYTPDVDTCGSDSFTYTVSDGNGGLDTGTVDVSVTCIDDAPIANNQSVTTSVDTPANITLSGSDVDGDPLTYAIVDQPDNGVLSGSGANRIYTPDAGYTGPDTFTYTANDGTTNSNVATVNISVTSEPVGLLEYGTVTVGGSAVTVNLNNSYVSPVVVGSAQYDNNSTPIVVRISNVTSSSFDVRLQNPSGGAVSSDTVSYLVVEEGVWTIDGVDLEAQTYLSTVTDSDGSWVGQAQSYGQSYNNPVVLGQVMSENDADWSAFWSQGGSRTDPPSASTLITGKMVGEDSDTTRANETIGFIVFEAGHGTLNGVEFEALLGATSIQGVDDSPPYVYTFDTVFGAAPQAAIVTMAGVDGPNGGWAQTHGPTAANTTSLFLSIDEDQVGDAERNHTSEQVAYVAFGGTPNTPPVADDQSVSTDEDTPVAITLTGSDSDGDSLSYAIVSQPSNGVLSGTGANVTYTPDADYNGPDSFTFLANDGATNSNVATVSITVDPVNDAPVADDQSVSTAEDTPVAMTLTGSDADEDSLTYAIVDQPDNGDLSGTGANVTYTPDADYNGSDSFTFQVNDGQEDSNIATVSISVSSEPVGLLEYGTVTVGGSAVTVNLNNTYISPVVVASAQYDNNTTPVVVRISNVTATSFDVRLQNPSDGSVAADTVSYLVVEEGIWTIDGVNVEAQTYLSTVTDSDGSWVGQAQSYGQSYNNPVVLGQVMTENDADWSVFWSQGSSRTNPPSASTLVTGKMVGEDSDTTRSNETIGFIVFEAGHGTLNGVEFEALLGPDTVEGVGNSPPDVYTFDTAFASTPQAAIVTMAGVDGANGGWAQTHGPTMANTTSLFLSIDEDQIGDTERNHINEQVAYVAFGGTANTALVAGDDSATTDEDTSVDIDVLANDSDGDGDSLTVSSVTQPANGSASNNGSDVTYTPDADTCGPDSFSYTVSDGNNGSDTATVNVTVTCINDVPVADDQSVSTEEDTPVAITLTGSDVDEDALTFAIVSGPSNGVLSGSGANVTYTPDAGYNGPDSFTFQVNDGQEDSNLATISITVTEVNNAPEADDQSVSTEEDTPVAITLTGSDGDGDALTFTVVDQPSNGSLNGSGAIRTYTPDADYNGSDSFTFQVNDGQEDSNIATVTITVDPINDAPIADDQSVSTEEDTPVAIILSGSDVDEDALTFTIVDSPNNGVLSGSVPNVTYTPDTGYTGPDSFIFQTNDGQADSNIATVNITVSEVPNIPPLADAGSDQLHTLTAGQTTIDVTLDGSASSDPDGTVTGYTWSGTPDPADVVGPHVTLGVGVHTFTLVVTDNEGAPSNPDTVTITVNGAEPATPTEVYVSADQDGQLTTGPFADEDILALDLDTGNWSLYFDASDVGIGTGLDLFALHILNDGSILLSFDTAQSIGSLGTVDDSDIVRFIPTSLGSQTAGSFEWYFDGSDVGLTENDEDIDAISLTPSGALLISTVGNVSVPGVDGVDEDLLIFNATSLGQDTSGTWAPYFDGSDVGLTTNNEDVNGSWVDSSGGVYLTTLGSYSVAGVSGGGADIFLCEASSLGTDTSCSFSIFWRGVDYGAGALIADAIAVGSEATLQTSLSVTNVEWGSLVPEEVTSPEPVIKGDKTLFLPLIVK